MLPEVPSPSRGSGFGFRLRSRQLSETILVPEPPPIFPMLAVVLSCHVALRKLCDCAGGRLDAVDAVLRVKTGMGGFSLDFSLRKIQGSEPHRLPRRLRRSGPERTLLLPAPGCSRRHSHLCSTAPHRLKSGFRSGGAVLLVSDEVADSFIDRGHTGQIIGAENSCAVARYGSVIMENSLFPFCGLHRVHVGGKENRRTCQYCPGYVQTDCPHSSRSAPVYDLL